LHKRSSGRVTQKLLVAGELSLNPRTLEIRFGRNEVKLPPKCIRLLETMMAEPGRLFSRTQLESAVWGDTQETSDSLRSHMHILRRTLVEAGGRDPIETVHGLGYRLVPDAAAQA
jgi:DNA-binding response OmpR family regulator